ncbi:HEPN domain-containing protein [Sediminibacterium ginsengisoli]|uniref:Uncharacterized protein n=1 Tax=Sediminibacterium ginsengisoli TaxID=413434 RepID=A0A1T4R4A8_9BACT|nr:HEPN domain-containing protein [Sediminibacterium ginsengisoli]SKA10894.1 hypothetical protein SAMN04488132_110130 [Sediminibacterium ginsengisoli]
MFALKGILIYLSLSNQKNEMHEKFTFKAKWWLPENDGKQEILGELQYEPNGNLIAILEGSLFGTTDIHKSDHNISLPVVHGISKEGHCISLFDVKAWEVGRTGWVTMELYPEFVLMSEHNYLAVPNMEIMNFNFCLNGFGAFFRGHENRLVPNHSEGGVISFDYKQPSAIEIIDDEECNIYFYFQYQYNGLSEVATDTFNFKERIYFNVHWNKQGRLDEFVQQLKFYGDFFRFFSQEILSFDHVNVFAKAIGDKKAGFRFIYKQPSQYVGVRPSTFHSLLTYNEVKLELSTIMRNWIKHKNYIAGGLSLYIQTKYVRFPTPAQLFLNLAFAIETFHKTFFGNNRKLYLSDRIDELIVENETILASYSLNKIEFAEKVNKQRNYLAHDHSAEDRSHITHEEYEAINTFLEIIFELSFLRLLGVSESLLQKMVKRNDNYQKIVANGI